MKTIGIIGIFAGIATAITIPVVIFKKLKKPEVLLDESGNVVDPAQGNSSDVLNQGNTGDDKSNDPRLKEILNKFKQNGKFDNNSDAEYFIKNIDYLGEDERPSIADTKLALRRSNMAFFDNKVSDRMSMAEVDKYIIDNAPIRDGKKVQLYNGGFDSPDFSNHTDYQLKKLLAHGYWFGLWYDGGGTYAGHNQGYAATSAGGNFLVTTFDLWGNNDSHKRKVFVPEKYKGDTYSYSFSGDKKNVKLSIMRNRSKIL